MLGFKHYFVLRDVVVPGRRVIENKLSKRDRSMTDLHGECSYSCADSCAEKEEEVQRRSSDKHSTEIGAYTTFRVNARTDARRRRRSLSVGRVLILNNPHAWKSSDPTR